MALASSGPLPPRSARVQGLRFRVLRFRVAFLDPVLPTARCRDTKTIDPMAFQWHEFDPKVQF